jgi:hypothetical protein
MHFAAEYQGRREDFDAGGFVPRSGHEIDITFPSVADAARLRRFLGDGHGDKFFTIHAGSTYEGCTIDCESGAGDMTITYLRVLPPATI